MARARNIKPGFFTNDRLAELDPLARLYFIGLWTVANYQGCLEYRPKRLKIQLLPFDNCKIERITSALVEGGFLRIYAVDGIEYLHIVNFEKHQTPHKNEREAGTDIPPPTVEVFKNQEVDTEPNNSEPLPKKDELEKEGIRNQESGIRNQNLSSLDEIFAYWQFVHDKPRAQFTIERKRKVRERLADSTVEEIKLAIDGCKRSPHHQGQNEKGAVYDDLELICRTRTHLEKFISYTQVKGNGNRLSVQLPSATELLAEEAKQRPALRVPPKIVEENRALAAGGRKRDTRRDLV